MEEAPLQQELLDLLVILQNLNPPQLTGFLSFVRHDSPRIDLGMLTQLAQQLTNDQLERLATLSGGDEAQAIPPELNISKDVLRAYASLLRILNLQTVLSRLSEMQLMKLYEVIPSEYSEVMQLQLLQQLQEFLDQLLPEALQNLQKELEEAEPGKEGERLKQLLDLKNEQFHLYNPLLQLLQLEWEELQPLQLFLPKLRPAQAVALLQILKSPVYEALEMRGYLRPHSQAPTDEGHMEVELEVTPTRPHLEIVEQPPERQVYKRNLKPNPVVRVVVPDAENDGALCVAPILIRCDTLEDVPRLMTGTQPIKIGASKIVTFRKLKVTTTSHMQGETLFCIRFELRRYSGHEFEVLNFVQSNPIMVLSHSTQLKPSSSSNLVPVVTEVIPFSGSCTGGTRVAVIGQNFVDNPALRIRFDTVDVMPIFHGPGTLICTTPQHAPGAVPIRVSNDNKKWSETTGTFTYEDIATSPDPVALSAFLPGQLDLSALSGLTEAVWQGNFDSVKLFGDMGADVNHKDARQYAPMHYAAASGHLAILHYLLQRGADINVRDNVGNTPLYWAVFSGHLGVAEHLIMSGANPNAVNYWGDSPLQLATRSGDERAVQLLLQFGASPRVADVEGETPLHAAASRGYLSLATLLVSYGAFVNSPDMAGESPLWYAIRQSQIAVASALLQWGAAPFLPNEDGETPLHLATEASDRNLAALLIRSGAPLNAQDKEGRTPLHEALDGADEAMGQFLLSSGADVNRADGQGRRPLHSAAVNGLTSVLQSILARGGDLKARNYEGLTPFDVAPRRMRPYLSDLCCSQQDHSEMESSPLSSSHLLVSA